MVHAISRPAGRITTLDVLQGVVLLALLIAQGYGHFASPYPGHSLRLDEHHPDLPVHFILQLLVSGQFDRLGSFLFGLGFYQCWQHAGLDGPGLDGPGLDGPGLDGPRIAQRLLLLLLVIGLCLSLLIRSADLLFQYALLGFTLPYFCRHSVSSLLGWMVGLAGLGILVPSLLSLLPAFHLPMTSFRTGSVGEFLNWQCLREWLVPGRSVSKGFTPFISYELMMLGGMLIGKLGILPRDIRLRMHLSLLQLLLLPVAFIVKGAWVVLAFGLVVLPEWVVAYQPVLLILSGFVGPLLLTGVYLLDMGLNTRLIPWGKASWLGQVGQMGLTNYVLQLVLCPLLLYGYGVAVSGPIPLWGRAGIVVGIYTFLIGFSRVWRKHYRQGPIEWVCRQWIYNKWGQSNSVTMAKR
ncbi:DUF418 domain-containing protein [Spirosoma aerolatum]|uniref:DUF418 domain-containing protein n=1 Tax=Spirosoma aerolatum TaxID=1211326 RepID=UPI0012D2A439|nr:DUF418 domain-containing protein [Spirosoma aerolatum]